jgi:tryptophan-rich hypothetical protein
MPVTSLLIAPVSSSVTGKNFSAMLSKEQNPPKPLSPLSQLSPKKLLLSKWTAVHPTHKRKHFLVSKVILPELPDGAIEFVELEAVFDRQVRTIPWRDLKNTEIWLQGWV